MSTKNHQNVAAAQAAQPKPVAAVVQATSEQPVRFITQKIKKLAEVTAMDVPPGLDPEDVASDCGR